MPKVSVYIPDDLWDRVKKVQPDAAGSQFIQETIREYVDRRERKPYATLTPELVTKRDAAAAKAQRLMVSDYQLGYAVGLEIADYLSWDLFHGFAQLSWDLEKCYQFVIGAPREWFTTNHGEFDLDQVWEKLVMVYDIGPKWPEGATREGLVDALGDVWEEIANAGSQEPKPPKTPASAAQAPSEPEGPGAEATGVVVPFREEAGDAG